MISDPFVLAIWYMDDGGVRRYRDNIYYIYLNTHSFTEDEVRKVANTFKKDLALDSVLEMNHEKWRLRVGNESVAKFIKIVNPYILPLFRYKLSVAL